MRIYTTEKEIRGYQAGAIAAQEPMERAMTLSDLKLAAFDYGGRRFADEETRLAILEEAVDFPGFAKLQIPTLFESFMENGRFLLGFLQEAAQERVPLERLAKMPGYERYGEHVRVLEKLFARYSELMERAGLVCPATAPEVAVPNEGWLRAFAESGEKMTLHYAGYLSRFEMEMLARVAERVPLKMLYATSRFSGKMNARLEEFFGQKVPVGRLCEFDFSAKTLRDLGATPDPVRLSVQPCPNLAAQAGYAHAMIEKFVREGIAPDEIAVVVQTKETALFLYHTDRAGNLNLSAGFPMKGSGSFRRLDALVRIAMDASRENRERWARLCGEDPSLAGMDLEVRHLWNAAADRFRDVVRRIAAPYDADEVTETFMRAAASTETVASLFPDATLGKTLLRLRRRLEDLSVPHKHGGRVTVMQPLEARQVQARAYVFLDFNDRYVPSDSVKDIFLDTEIREEAGLPTYRDREDLQRYYYETIFSRAERVAVAYRETESDTVSRLLLEFPVSIDDYDPVLLSSIAVPVTRGPAPRPFDGDVAFVGSLLESPLSATRLKTFLTCPRKYYFRYLMKLEEPESRRTPFADVGVMVHEALLRVYSSPNHPRDEEGIYEAIDRHLREAAPEGAYMELQRRIWKDRLKALARNDALLFSEGWRVAAVEKTLYGEYAGVRIYGKVDRIDVRGDEARVIDYKTGAVNTYTARSVDFATDFQMEFYRLLAEQNGFALEGVYYYDLGRSMDLIPEPLHEKKLEMLEERIGRMKGEVHSFPMEGSSSDCRVCPYAEICGTARQSANLTA